MGVQIWPRPPCSGSAWQPGPPPQLTFPEEEGLGGSAAGGTLEEGRQPVGFASTRHFLNCNLLKTQSIPRKAGLGPHPLRCHWQMAPLCLAPAYRDSPKPSHPLALPLDTSLSPQMRVQEPAPSSPACTSIAPHTGARVTYCLQLPIYSTSLKYPPCFCQVA